MKMLNLRQLTLAFLLLTFVLTTPAWSQRSVARGETHQVLATNYYRTFSRLYPVLKRVKPGDTVATKTLDAGGQDEKDVRRSEPGNPLTGPFFVEGAEAGDALVIRFLKVRMNRNWGWTAYRLGLFSLTPESIEGLYPNRYKDDLIRPGRSNLVPWDIDLQRQTVRLREPVTPSIKLEFPAKPMLGCVGVAPAGDFAPTSGPSGSYGGNLDYNEIGEGSVVMLPVYHPGALLFIGDGHALQADGEPTGTGVETVNGRGVSGRGSKEGGLVRSACGNLNPYHQYRKPAGICQLAGPRSADGDQRHGELVDHGIQTRAGCRTLADRLPG